MAKDIIEETLDPQDWAELRALGHQMLDNMFDHLATLSNRPAWQPMPEKVQANFTQPLPMEGIGTPAVYQEFLENILPYPNGNLHPRYWGWVQGTGTPLAMLADMLASGLNPHMAGFNQAPKLVEEQVILWLAQLMGMPAETSGLLTSGGTMASITGLMVARYAKAGFNVHAEGLSNSKLVFYGSRETHSWAQSAASVLGLGKNSFRAISVDKNFCIDLKELRERISADREAGYQPFCVIGTAGTVNTGATDDLSALADICQQENLWFHIDGAFGALVALVPELKSIVAGIERADSLAFDLHKWMYLPFEIGCILVRDKKLHLETFASKAPYLAETSRGVMAGSLPFANRGIELTRGFKALKLWMTLKAYGVGLFSRLIAQNVHQAQYLANLVSTNPNLELLAPVPLNIVCFRFRADGLNQDQLNALNEEILLQIQENGIAVPSSTIINGAFALRVAIVNHRSRLADFDLLIKAVLEYGQKLAST